VKIFKKKNLGHPGVNSIKIFQAKALWIPTVVGHLVVVVGLKAPMT